jgi:hypothetical protein
MGIPAASTFSQRCSVACREDADMAPKPEHNLWIKSISGIDPTDYEPHVLRSRYDALMPLAAAILKVEAKTKAGQQVRRYLIDGIGMNMSQKSSSVILKWIDAFEKSGDREAASHAKSLLDYTHDEILRFNREESAVSNVPTFSDNMVATADLSVEMLKKYAEDAKHNYTLFMGAHATLFNLLNDGLALWKTATPVKDCYDLINDIKKFDTTMPMQEAAAAASIVLGPVGPGAGYLIIITEAFGLVLELLNVVVELIDLIQQIGSGKPLSESMSKGIDHARTADWILHWYKNCNKTLESVKTTLHSASSGLSSMAKVGNRIHKLLHG